MLGVRGVIVVLVLFHVALVTVGALQSADFAWGPSYFDDDDGDFLPALLAERPPAPVDLGGGWIPALIVLTAVVAERPRSRPRLAAARAPLRAPPCP